MIKFTSYRRIHDTTYELTIRDVLDFYVRDSDTEIDDLLNILAAIIEVLPETQQKEIGINLGYLPLDLKF